MAGKYSAQDNYNDRQLNKGRIRVSVWVPKTDKPKLVKYAKGLCRAANRSAA